MLPTGPPKSAMAAEGCIAQGSDNTFYDAAKRNHGLALRPGQCGFTTGAAERAIASRRRSAIGSAMSMKPTGNSPAA